MQHFLHIDIQTHPLLLRHMQLTQHNVSLGAGTQLRCACMFQSGGVLGRWKRPGDSNRVPVPVHFSNPDLLWATDYPAPRFGQGAFAAALRELHQQVLGSCQDCSFPVL